MNMAQLIDNPFQLNLMQQQQLQLPLDFYSKNFQTPQQMPHNMLLQQDPSSQSSSSSLQQNYNAHQQQLFYAMNSMNGLNGINGNNALLLQNQNAQFQMHQQSQPTPNSYFQNVNFNDAQILKNTIQQSQQNQYSNLQNNQRNQQMLFNALMKNQENNLSLGQNPLMQLQERSGEKGLNEQFVQNQITQLKNKQAYENSQMPILMLLQQQQQQQQIQQIQQQQQQQQQLQQYFLHPQQLLLQQQAQQSQILDSKDIPFRTNHTLSNQDFNFTNHQTPSDLRLLNFKQDVNGYSQDKFSSNESPNMSYTTLPAPSNQRNSFSNVSQSTPSSLNLGLYSQSSPLIQTKPEQQQNAFQGMIPPHQLNFLLQQIQQQQQQQFGQFPQLSSNQLPFNKMGLSLPQKIEFTSLNDESRNLKQKKKSNPKRNTIKNLGNQIISFMCNKKSIQIIKQIPLIDFEESEFEEFKKFCEQYKNKMLKIADLRNIWISNKTNIDEKSLKYHKMIRVLSRFYLNNEAIPKLLTSNKLKDRKIHLSIRRILVEKLKDPESFTTLNQYSKK